MARSDDQPTVGIITATPVESVAMEHLLRDVMPVQVSGDPNRYRLGRISGRPVLMTALARIGNTVAADACANLCRSFPGVHTLIMCGIALGVPRPDDPGRHVRLGDIVVGVEGVLHYSLRTVTDIGGLTREPPIPAASGLLRCVRELQAAELKDHRPWEDLLAHPPFPAYARPPDRTDRLTHDRHPARQTSAHRPGMPKVHYGRIGSGDELLRNARRRDEIARAERLLALEMEGAGVADSSQLGDRGCLVVRGISDYGDRAKSDLWQPYAALAAAAYVRTLLEAYWRPAMPLNGRAPGVRGGLGREALFEIVRLMEGIPSLQTSQGRDTVVSRLGTSLAASIPRHHTPRMDLVNIVDTCANHSGGFDSLLQVIEFLEGPDSVPARMLADAATRLRPGRST